MDGGAPAGATGASSAFGWLTPSASATVFASIFGLSAFAAPFCAFLARALGSLVSELRAFGVEAETDARDGEVVLVFTGLPEVFFSYVKVAFFAGAFIAFPIIATQLYMFIAPGLYRREKRAFLPYLIAAPILFFLGGAMVYYVIFPLAWAFFLSFQMTGGEGSASIEVLPRVGEYLNLSMKLIFAFGLAFQLPIALTLMARVGIVNAAGLRKKRKFAIVGVFIFAAILTPPDIISQVGLAVPILALYEISIWLAHLIEKRREDQERAEEAAAE